MEDHYDFSAAKRGRFFRADASFVPPVHLQPDVLACLLELADARKVSLNDLVNTLLKEHLKKRP